MALLCAAPAWAQGEASAAPTQPVPPLIALDIGHYLAAPGATSARGVPEFEFNRALVQTVDAQLRASGLRTELIGADGMASDLASRPRRARDVNALLFISFHHDSARERFLKDWEVDGKPRRYLDDRFQGYSLFVSRQNPQWRQALDCASAFGAQLRAAGFKPSRYHADPVIGENREFADETNGVHFFDNLAVLRHATVPALLFEAGVIVNRDEEARLGTDATRARIAEALAAAMPTCVTQAIKVLGIPRPASSAAEREPQRNNHRPKASQPRRASSALASPAALK
jgi:N-acetylmuramoyl-L-alanine amidase